MELAIAAAMVMKVLVRVEGYRARAWLQRSDERGELKPLEPALSSLPLQSAQQNDWELVLPALQRAAA